MPVVFTDAAPAAIGPYSQAIAAGGLLFCSGQIALDPATGTLTGETVADQTRLALRNLAAVLAAGGCSPRDIAKTTVFLRSMDDFAEMNGVYAEWMGGHAPARSTVAVAGLPRGAKVEIEATAVLPPPGATR